MSETRETLVLVNGFDRSGTSAITRTLACHPSIELFMQPFNSGPFRKLMYEIVNDDLVTKEDCNFFQQLIQGNVVKEYIQSEWFFKFSSTTEVVPGKLHLIKSTISHLMIPWLQERFPEIDVWGIWREPQEVLESVFRNQFETWYANSYESLSRTIRGDAFLLEKLGNFLQEDIGPVEEAALNFAVRSLHYFSHIPPGNILRFEQFCSDPNRTLGRFLDSYDLPRFDFSAVASADHNIIGKRDPVTLDPFHQYDLTQVHQILAPVESLINDRFSLSTDQH